MGATNPGTSDPGTAELQLGIFRAQCQIFEMLGHIWVDLNRILDDFCLERPLREENLQKSSLNDHSL
jgi:hypothetical protein